MEYCSAGSVSDLMSMCDITLEVRHEGRLGARACDSFIHLSIFAGGFTSLT
jgi:hypothetical protein